MAQQPSPSGSVPPSTPVLSPSIQGAWKHIERLLQMEGARVSAAYEAEIAPLEQRNQQLELEVRQKNQEILSLTQRLSQMEEKMNQEIQKADTALQDTSLGRDPISSPHTGDGDRDGRNTSDRRSRTLEFPASGDDPLTFAPSDVFPDITALEQEFMSTFTIPTQAEDHSGMFAFSAPDTHLSGSPGPAAPTNMSPFPTEHAVTLNQSTPDPTTSNSSRSPDPSDTYDLQSNSELQDQAEVIAKIEYSGDEASPFVSESAISYGSLDHELEEAFGFEEPPRPYRWTGNSRHHSRHLLPSKRDPIDEQDADVNEILESLDAYITDS
ncbi:hypothetical protein EIP91_001645 [Steccherinum ochraceum]|uniref:Uncharacterized protein n=1 Tax=Steccherinum ochraceum TaxID=92696 RepID=A0A4R0RQT8_9APHY|nr:hypothetical protein EIP91_001645 [Steccherinum ochraceum]